MIPLPPIDPAKLSTSQLAGALKIRLEIAEQDAAIGDTWAYFNNLKVAAVYERELHVRTTRTIT